MANYKIIRVYEIPGDDKVRATNRMMAALALGMEKDYHVVDFIRSPQSKGPLEVARVSLEPPKGWLTTFLSQLLGRSEPKAKR